MARVTIARMHEIASPRYWRRRRVSSKRSQAAVRRRANFMATKRRLQDETRAVARLSVESAGLLLCVLLAVVALEAACDYAGSTDWGRQVELFDTPDASLQDTATSLVSTLVAIAATILGLYYASVGVIASTIYKSVPADIRKLFITERGNEAYLRVVITTILYGITLLVLDVFDRHAAAATLAVMGILASITCIGLVGVTRRLFDYFDPSRLSVPLVASILGCITIATSAATRELSHRQAEANQKAVRSLISFKHLVTLLESIEFRNAAAPVALTRQLLGMWSAYSTYKHLVPTSSNWWNRFAMHDNWLTIDHMRLEMALNTGTALPPKMEADYLWFESTIARLLRSSLRAAFKSNSGAHAVAVSEEVSNLAGTLTARLQIEEAVILQNSWEAVMTDVTESAFVADSMAEPLELKLNQIAAAESLVLPLTNMILGIASASRDILRRDLEREFTEYISNPDSTSVGELPTATRKLLERISDAVKREMRVETKKVTPSWWVAHAAGRSFSEELLATESGVLTLTAQSITPQVQHFIDSERPDLAVVVGMASLELLNKLAFHEPTYRQAEAKLAEYKNVNAGSRNWPKAAREVIDIDKQRADLLRTLSRLLPRLDSSSFDPRHPDLYGQLFQYTVDGAFQAIINDDRVTAAKLYMMLFTEVERARVRISADLEDQFDDVRALYSAELLVTVMDLAGYALLMNELNDGGIWLTVKGFWDTLLDAKPEAAQFFLLAATFSENTLALTSGNIERSRRAIRLRQLLETRDTNVYDATRNGPRDTVPDDIYPKSAIAHAFLPTEYGMDDDLYALFISEYLAHRLPPGTDLGFRSNLVSERLKGLRRDTEEQSPEPEDIDDDDI